MITIDVSKVTAWQWFKFLFVFILASSFGEGIGSFLAAKTMTLF
jgi:hypothetical protein